MHHQQNRKERDKKKTNKTLSKKILESIYCIETSSKEQWVIRKMTPTKETCDKFVIKCAVV